MSLRIDFIRCIKNRAVKLVAGVNQHVVRQERILQIFVIMCSIDSADSNT